MVGEFGVIVNNIMAKTGSFLVFLPKISSIVWNFDSGNEGEDTLYRRIRRSFVNINILYV